MVNPYKSPHELPLAPLSKRLRRGLNLAMAEYRSGLQRDGFSRLKAIHAWMSLFVVLFFALAIAAVMIFLLLTWLDVI